MSTAARILELLASDDGRVQGLELMRSLDNTDVFNAIVARARAEAPIPTGDGLGYRQQAALSHPDLPGRTDREHPGLLLALLRADSDAAAAMRQSVQALLLSGEDAWLLPEAVRALPALEVAGIWEPGLPREALADPALADLTRLHVHWRGDPAPLLDALAGCPAPLVSLELQQVRDLSALAGIPRIFLKAESLQRGLAALADAPIERLSLSARDQDLSLEALEALPHLRRLQINDGSVRLRALPNRLEALSLNIGRVSGFEHLAAFPELRQVEITSAIAPTAAPLASYLPPGLLALTIRCPQDAPHVLAEPAGLARFGRLRSMKVSGALDVSALGQSAPPRLRALWPSATDGLASLAGLRGAPELEWLSVSRCGALSSLAGLEEHGALIGAYAGNCGRLADVSALASCSELALVSIERCRARLPAGLQAEQLKTFGALWERMRRRGWGERIQGYDTPD